MRIELVGPAKGRNKSVGTEMIAPLWPEPLPNPKPQAQPLRGGAEERQAEVDSERSRLKK